MKEIIALEISSYVAAMIMPLVAVILSAVMRNESTDIQEEIQNGCNSNGKADEKI